VAVTMANAAPPLLFSSRPRIILMTAYGRWWRLRIKQGDRMTSYHLLPNSFERQIHRSLGVSDLFAGAKKSNKVAIRLKRRSGCGWRNHQHDSDFY